MQQTISIPAISIIIPTYNAEKYIGELFESLLEQTFKDFELILIDDCSIDRTVEIIEKYIPRFGGDRFQLIKRQKNFGYAGTIRNVFASHARGKYILNLDNDDILLPDALENFFDAAENFNADFVTTEGYYLLDEIHGGKIELQMCKGDHVDKPVIEVLDISERLRRFRAEEVIRFHWNKLIRRDFLIRNRIEFPDMPISHDVIFCLQLFLLSDRWVRIPAIANVYRISRNSWSQQMHGNGNRMFKSHAKDLVVGTKFIEDFLNRIEYFKENPEIIYEFTEYFVSAYVKNFLTEHQIGGYWVEETLREVFSRNPSDNIPLMIHLFNLLRLNFK